MGNGDRQGVQYSVGKERLWPATHDERIVALLTIAENDLRTRGTI